MASADFSDPIPNGCPPGSPMHWTEWETSRGKTCLLLPDASDLPRGVPHDYRASPSLAGLPTPQGPYIRHNGCRHRCLFVASEISSSAFFRSRLATGTLA